MNQTQLGSFESIPLSAIRPSATNPRKHFDPVALEELTRSVSEMGVTNPLLLRHCGLTDPDGTRLSGGGWIEIVSGERRYRAAKAAGLETVPAILKEISDNEALDLQMIENLQRADLHPMEEAEGYRVLEAHGATPEDIAKRSGKTLSQVVQTMRLLSLELKAKELFSEGHITLGHARLLAKLTPEQQTQALLYLLEIDGKTSGDQSAEDKIRQRISIRSPHIQNGLYARLISASEAQLRNWIESHVLLQLANVPWHLADALLVPAAGPCTTCPKRTGANVALFQDLTTAEDTCTDPTCFAAKQTAQLNRQKEAAKTSGAPLLKISSKRSNEKLEERAVEVVKGATTVTKKTVKEGQWVPSEEGACGGTVHALMQDGPDKGKLAWVCADQKCKVHKHTVSTPQTNATSERSQKQQEEAKANKLDRYLCELKIRAAFLQEATAGIASNAQTVREAIASFLETAQNYRDTFPVLALAYGIELPPFDGETWHWSTECRKLLIAKVNAMTSLAALNMVLINLQIGRMIEPDFWGRDNRDAAIEAMAEYGVDASKAEAIAGRITAEHNAPKLELEIQAAAEPAGKHGKKKLSAADQAKRKADAAKKFPSRALTPEQRKNVAAAQAKRFTERKAKAANAETVGA